MSLFLVIAATNPEVDVSLCLRFRLQHKRTGSKRSHSVYVSGRRKTPAKTTGEESFLPVLTQ